MKSLKFLILAIMTVFAYSASSKDKPHFISQTNSEFAQTITRPNIQLLDVRTAQEYADGHIPNSTNIDVTNSNFNRRISTLNKQQPVAVYCRSGARSKKAAAILVSKGFTVYELDNGFMNWDGQSIK